MDVEAHVLRYWEEELELPIPRNDMGHRYYTDFHIRLFKQVKVLKEKGYQLKAIKTALAKSLQDGKVIIPSEVLEEDVIAALKETGIGEQDMKEQKGNENKNGEKLSQDISYLVHDKLMKEMEYLMRVSDEREEERFKQLDEVIRAYQRDNQGRAEAAASVTGFPFFRFKKKKFGRNGNKL